jgi:hypothetical protein
MAFKVLHGFAWYAYPDTFGFDEGAEAPDPGHPFADGQGGVKDPPEVIYYFPLDAADSGVRNELRPNAYLVLTKTQLHPLTSRSWESEPAVLAEGFKTADSRIKLTRIVQNHRRHTGDLLEIELRIERTTSPAPGGAPQAT